MYGISTLTEQKGVNSLGLYMKWWHWHVWQQRSASTLAQAMACCLMAPSHYLNQCWLIIVMSIDIHLRAILQKIPHPPIIKINLKITFLKISFKSPRDQWVKITDVRLQLHLLGTNKLMEYKDTAINSLPDGQTKMNRARITLGCHVCLFLPFSFFPHQDRYSIQNSQCLINPFLTPAKAQISLCTFLWNLYLCIHHLLTHYWHKKNMVYHVYVFKHIYMKEKCINSLRPSDAIWRHNLSQYWLR